MKKLIISLIASFMLCAFAYSEDKERPQTGGSDPKPEIGQPNKPDPVGEYRHLEKLIADKKAFAERAKFTQEGLAEFQAEIKALETRLDDLKKIPEVAICVFPPPRPQPFPPHWGKPPAAQTKDLRPLPGGFGMGSSTLANWIKENIEEDKANGKGPDGEKPKVERPRFPLHWGKPPAAQTKDLRPLPGGFGMGSSTLANWIKENIEEDKANGKGPDGEKPKVERPRFPLHWGKPPEIQLTDHVKLPGNFGEGSSTLAHWIKENIEEDKANGKGPGKEKPDILTDKEKLDPRKVEAEVLKKVREGTLSREDAKKKLDALREEMEKNHGVKRPKRPKKPELSEDVKNTLQGIKDLQDALAKEMKTKLDGLKKDGATREEMREAVHAFQKDNKDSLEDIRKLHNKIHSHLKVPHKPERPELTPKIKVEVEVLKEKQKELHTARKALHENLKDKSKEDREALIADFKKENKTKHEAIKAQAKVVKEEIRALVETEATRTSDL